MTSDEIREAFLAYFAEHNHDRVDSASLIPVGDPTLLLTNAGMVQFKPYFTGEAVPPNKRLTSTQKSFRTVDIDEVGDSTHLTLFEMLGNFSIGDYFKKDAIFFSLDLVTTKFGLDRDKFFITIHDSDDEAGELWSQIGIPDERIFKFGDADNWWGPAGAEGPCGPCSELHYDFGSDKGCQKANCRPNCENVVNAAGDICTRFVELWNLVFMQFYQDIDGSRSPLPAPSVDTGMGLERAAVILQDVSTIYETDLFRPLISKLEEISGCRYKESREVTYAMHVVAEHIRSSTFLIADGVVPGNEGRGYVLRRVIRRAIRHANRLGLNETFLGEMSDVVIDNMSNIFPELKNHRDFILTVLLLEEEKFKQAFDNGYAVLMNSLKDRKTLSGEIVFKLWDTYGFPVEMTHEIANELGVAVDLDGFELEMGKQRERAKETAKFSGDRAKIRVYESLGIKSNTFRGYDNLNISSVIIGLIVDDEVVSQATEGEEVEVVLVETPFYPEGGGQIGDAGQMIAMDSKVEIYDSQTVMPGLVVNFGKVTKGTVNIGESVDLYVDPIRREDTARNHTSTHLLHSALRQVLGPHVRQAGSLVAPDRLRFDFTHMQSMTNDEIWQTQLLVNEKIRQNARVIGSEDSYSSAINRGALAFFGDKYGDTVRLIEIANGASFSFEVCGGTHVHNTGEVGSFYLLNESSIGSGVRRIEAVSGRAGEKLVWDRFKETEHLATVLQSSITDLPQRVSGILTELDELKRSKVLMDRQLSMQAAKDLLENKRNVNGITVLTGRAPANNADTLREVADWLRDQLSTGVIVLGSVTNERPIIVSMVTPDLVEKGFDARDIARDAAKEIQGGGGGKPEVAQAGGKRAEKLDEALESVIDIVREKSLLL